MAMLNRKDEIDLMVDGLLVAAMAFARNRADTLDEAAVKCIGSGRRRGCARSIQISSRESVSRVASKIAARGRRECQLLPLINKYDMGLKPHQAELLARDLELDPRDVPSNWSGAADLDARIEAKREKRLALVPKRTPDRSAVTRRKIDDMDMFEMGKAIRGLIEERLAPLESRLAELESRPPGLLYDGVWEAGKNYPRHTGVSQGGSVWVALVDTPTGPPGATADWQLACKRGRDGKDGKP
jgi:hypothetical protein